MQQRHPANRTAGIDGSWITVRENITNAEAGGNNRAVAQAAFADRLPAPVVARRTKGAFDGFGPP
jgi:hypothetical protein